MNRELVLIYFLLINGEHYRMLLQPYDGLGS